MFSLVNRETPPAIAHTPITLELSRSRVRIVLRQRSRDQYPEPRLVAIPCGFPLGTTLYSVITPCHSSRILTVYPVFRFGFSHLLAIQYLSGVANNLTDICPILQTGSFPDSSGLPHSRPLGTSLVFSPCRCAVALHKLVSRPRKVRRLKLIPGFPVLSVITQYVREASRTVYLPHTVKPEDGRYTG